eukprot:TRINITY_DN5230_c0_g1_i1.p1 TRINITY_DN5230_c0_g1~~TRINITY_DN5230_c0_g1_i1.p1  ORF type:complete len:218 (-),score=22.75 TRINITY_DN5230_c0_g1_i1:28-633(-)
MQRLKKTKFYQGFQRQLPLSITTVIFFISFAIYLGGIAKYIEGCDLLGWPEGRPFVKAIYYFTPFISAFTIIGNFIALLKNNKQLLLALPLLNASLTILYIIVIYGTWEHYTDNDVLINDCYGWRDAENPTIYNYCGKVVNGLGMAIAASLINGLLHVGLGVHLYMRYKQVKREEERVARSMLASNALEEDDLTLNEDDPI